MTVFGLQVERANQVVLAVGDVEDVALEGHSLRIGKAGLGERTVGLSRGPGAGHGDLLAVQVGNDNAMMRAVGDEEPLAGRIGNDLAGEAERSVLRANFLEAQRLLVQGSPGPVGADQPARWLGRTGVVDFFGGQTTHQKAFRVDQHDGRPGLHAVSIPDTPIRRR